MPREPELTYVGCFRWCIENNATVEFGWKNGMNHIVLLVGGKRYVGCDLLDLVFRVRHVMSRRKYWDKKEKARGERESVMDEFGSWLKERV